MLELELVLLLTCPISLGRDLPAVRRGTCVAEGSGEGMS